MKTLVFLLAIPAVACHVVLDIDDKRTESTVPSCESGEIPSGPHARVANLVAGSAGVALCLSPSGGGSVVRIPASKSGCPEAIGYAEVSAPVAADPGSYAARLVEAGAGCDSTPLFESSIELTNQGNTILWAGGESRAAELFVFGDSPPPPESYKLRFFHAAPADGPLDVGLANARGLPATVEPLIFPGLTFGTTGTPSSALTGVVDENGYVYGLANFGTSYGAADAGAKDAKFVSYVAGASLGQSYSIFAIGGESGAPRTSLLCNEGKVENGLTQCTTGTPSEASFEFFSATLAGLLLEYPDERAAELQARIGDFGSDVICIAEIWDSTIKDAIADAARPVYPHQLRADYGPDTPSTDPFDASGKIPAPRSTPYCSDPESKAALTALLDCIHTNCATSKPSGEYLAEASCSTTECVSASQALAKHPECGTCAVFLLGASSLAETKSQCETVNEPFAFKGQSGLLLLSRFPLEETTTFLAPSTLVRRELLHGRMRLPTGAATDVYCGYSSRIPIPSGTYTGVYGNGATGTEGWRNERHLYFDKLSKWVKATAKAPRSVIMGAFGTSPEGGENFKPDEPADFELLTSQFPLAVPPGFVPSCTVCADSPLFKVKPLFFDLVMYTGAATVVSAELTRTEPIVSVVDPLGNPLLVPLSLHYGFRSHLRVAP